MKGTPQTFTPMDIAFINGIADAKPEPFVGRRRVWGRDPLEAHGVGNHRLRMNKVGRYCTFPGCFYSDHYTGALA